MTGKGKWVVVVVSVVLLCVSDRVGGRAGGGENVVEGARQESREGEDAERGERVSQSLRTGVTSEGLVEEATKSGETRYDNVMRVSTGVSQGEGTAGEATEREEEGAGERRGRVQQITGEETARTQQSTGEGTARVQQNTVEETARVQQSTGEETARVQQSTGEETARVQQSTGEETARVQQSTGEETARVQQSTGEETARVQQRTGEGTARVQQRTGEETARVQQSTGAGRARVEQGAGESTRTMQVQYTAAVLEYAPYSYWENGGLGILQENARIFLEYATLAKNQGADIVVFPEYGLTSTNLSGGDFLSLSQLVPDPIDQVVPCSLAHHTNHTLVLGELSCGAAELGLYLVVDLAEQHPCQPAHAHDFHGREEREDEGIVENHNSRGEREERREGECPESGYLFYNTQVVLDRAGRVVARYRKRHLFLEPEFTQGTEDISTALFTTDFGVTFSLQVCFDIMYEEPAVANVVGRGVRDVAMSTTWIDELPFLTAPQILRGWSAGLGVNLLVANYHNPANGELGSGVFPGVTWGTSTYTYDHQGGTTLIVANLTTTTTSQPLLPSSLSSPSTLPVSSTLVDRGNELTGANGESTVKNVSGKRGIREEEEEEEEKSKADGEGRITDTAINQEEEEMGEVEDVSNGGNVGDDDVGTEGEEAMKGEEMDSEGLTTPNKVDHGETRKTDGVGVNTEGGSVKVGGRARGGGVDREGGRSEYYFIQEDLSLYAHTTLPPAHTPTSASLCHKDLCCTVTYTLIPSSHLKEEDRGEENEDEEEKEDKEGEEEMDGEKEGQKEGKDNTQEEESSENKPKITNPTQGQKRTPEQEVQEKPNMEQGRTQQTHTQKNQEVNKNNNRGNGKDEALKNNGEGYEYERMRITTTSSEDEVNLYKLLAYSGVVEKGGGVYSMFTQICAIVHCHNNDVNSCARIVDKNDGIMTTTFRPIQLRGLFATPYIFPSILLADLRLLSERDWSFTNTASNNSTLTHTRTANNTPKSYTTPKTLNINTNKESNSTTSPTTAMTSYECEVTVHNNVTNLLTLVLFGRWYTRDPPDVLT